MLPDPPEFHAQKMQILYKKMKILCSETGNSLHTMERQLLCDFLKYSDPSLSGDSQQRPPSLMWPQICGATAMNHLLLPLTKGLIS